MSAKVIWVSLLLVAISVPAAAKSCRDAVLDTNGNGHTYTCTRTGTDIVPIVQDMTVTTSPFPGNTTRFRLQRSGESWVYDCSCLPKGTEAKTRFGESTRFLCIAHGNFVSEALHGKASAKSITEIFTINSSDFVPQSWGRCKRQ